MRRTIRFSMKLFSKRGIRRYFNMAVSAYYSASWFSRIIILILIFTSITLIFQTFTNTASLISQRTERDVPVSQNDPSGVVLSVRTGLNDTFQEPPQEFQQEPAAENENEPQADAANPVVEAQQPPQEPQDPQQPDAAAPPNAAIVTPPLGGGTDKFGRPLSDAVKRLPDTLIIGARKGGTRALITFLAMHPKLVTTGDEVQFFNNNDSYAKGLGWYIEQMPPARPDQNLIEKTAEYFHVLWVPERVKEMNPDIKIILVIRDPFIRMVSDYNFLRRFASTNEVAGYEFPELKFTIEELAIDNKTGNVNTGYGGLHRSKYYKFFQNWLRHFPREQILIVNGDRLASENPALELIKVEQFLGIEPYFTEDFFYKDEEKGFYCITDVGCLGKEKGHKQPEFDPEFVRKVRSFLRPMNLLFYNLAGYDFNWE